MKQVLHHRLPLVHKYMSMVQLPVIGMRENEIERIENVFLNRFEVNLANRRGDIILHINPRVNDRQLVLNSAPGGAWGGEERKPLTIQRGQPFSIIVMVAQEGFKVNNQTKCFKD